MIDSRAQAALVFLWNKGHVVLVEHGSERLMESRHVTCHVGFVDKMCVKSWKLFISESADLALEKAARSLGWQG